MGYTRYYKITNEEELKAVKNVALKVLKNTVFKDFLKVSKSENSIIINAKEKIHFTKDKKRYELKGDFNHESFVIKISEFEFCKKARKPYDLYISAVLSIASKLIKRDMNKNDDGNKKNSGIKYNFTNKEMEVYNAWIKSLEDLILRKKKNTIISNEINNIIFRKYMEIAEQERLIEELDEELDEEVDEEVEENLEESLEENLENEEEFMKELREACELQLKETLCDEEIDENIIDIIIDDVLIATNKHFNIFDIKLAISRFIRHIYEENANLKNELNYSKKDTQQAIKNLKYMPLPR